MKPIFYLALILIVLIPCSIQGQSYKKPLEEISHLLERNEIQQADKELNHLIETWKNENNQEALAHCVYFLGKIQSITEEGKLDKAENLVNELELKNTSPSALFEAYNALAILNNDQADPFAAYELSEIARNFAVKSKHSSDLIDAEYYLADYAMRKGDFVNFENYIRSSVSSIENTEGKAPPISTKAYNLMGALLYFSSVPDSASYYYDKALAHIPFMEKTAENEFYIPATIKGNLTLLYQSQGKFSQAMELAKDAVKLNNQFLKNTQNHPLTYKAHRNLSIAYRNISSLYNDIGDFEKTSQIATIALEHAKENFELHSKEYFLAFSMCIEAELSAQNYAKALSLIQESNSSRSEIYQEDNEIGANINKFTARAYYGLDNYEKARKYFEKSDSLYEKIHPGIYGRDRLYALMNLSIVYADLAEKELAISTAKKVYNEYLKSGDESGYLTNSILISLTRIQLDLGYYDESLYWCQQALEEFKKQEQLPKTQFDQIQYEFLRSDFTMLKAKANYWKHESLTVDQLKEIYSNIKESISILDQRKSVINTTDGVNAMIETNTEILDFAKKVNHELYSITKDDEYLDELISLHESVIYNKIRARLNIKEAIKFNGVPQHVVTRENELRKKLNHDEYETDDYIESLNLFISNNEEWTSFVDSLRLEYPDYFKMRYGSIKQPIDNLLNQFKENTTLVRYFFIEENLYALILNSNEKQLLPLSTEQLSEEINQLQDFDLPMKDNCAAQHKIYKKIWAPIEEYIKGEHVVIIPDGVLFNLSFESLSTQPVDNYQDLIEHSLLKKYLISYNYSLFLTEQQKTTHDYTNDFVGFAPEFNEKMKSAYLNLPIDSLDQDQNYIHLLPQPHALGYAKKASDVLTGKSYIQEESTVANFKTHAGNHKIIYIGTHAEANNLNPELSRFFFAKNSQGEDNSLFNYEIYNCNLSCELAILTGCETGKPSYQPGEGMISLAHAFNYAGSKSILTSLWNIDEKTSIEIVELFQKYLEEGITKDRALQKAKIEFIETHHEKLIAPQYWAGIILMGDTQAIELDRTGFPYIYVTIAIVLLLVLIFLTRKRKMNPEA